MIQLRSRFSVLFALCCGCILLLSTVARAQTLIPVPMTSVYAGQPAATYNGSTSAGSLCTASGGLLTVASGYTWANAYGDGCIPTQAHLGYTIGLARDTSGNMYTVDNYGGEIRVIYNTPSANLAAAIQGGNPQAGSFTPLTGHIYGFGRQTSVITASGGKYYCGGNAANGQAADAYGSGCPAFYGVYSPRDVFVDSQGNIFFTSTGAISFSSVRVIYVGGGTGLGTAGAIIKAYYPTLTPTPGYVYMISVNKDFDYTNATQGINSIVVDSNENVYVSDNQASVTTGLSGIGSTTAGNQIKKFSFTAVSGTSQGWVTYVAGTNTSSVSGTSGTPAAAYGDGGPVASALTCQPTVMYVDANNNLYFGSGQDRRIRMVYAGGTPAAPPYVVGSTTNVVVSPTAGYVYTVVGGVVSQGSGTTQTYSNLINNNNGAASTGTVGGTPASGKIQVQYQVGMGQDNSGNLIVSSYNSSSNPTNSALLFSVNQATGALTVLGGQSANGTTGTTWPSGTPPVSGSACQSSTITGTNVLLLGGTGPTMTDAYGDGCPATMTSPVALGASRIVFDPSGNMYQADSITSSSTGSIIRQYTFPQQSMGSVDSTGVSLTAWVPYAFGSSSGSKYYTTAPTVALGNSQFTDNTTSDSCFTSGTTNGSNYAQTCVYNISFSPTSTGVQTASVTATSGSTSLGTSSVSATYLGVPVSTTTMLSVSPITYGAAAAVTATVAATSGTPTGNVVLSVNGTSASIPPAVLSSGTGAFSLTSLTAATYALTASYAAVPGFAASSTTSSTSLVVGHAPLTVMGVCSNRVFGQVNVCTAPTVSGYKYSDSAATVISGTPTSTTTAQRNSVAGSYPASPSATLTTFGTTNYTVSPVNGSFTISGGALQAIIFPALPNFASGGSYQLTARATSGLPVTYTVTAGSASVTGSTLTVTAPGLVTVQASQSVDPAGDYAAATPVSVSFTAQ